MRLQIRGFDIYKGHLDPAAQAKLVANVRTVARAAPMFSPRTPYGKPMSVRMTSAGSVGWYADSLGYRYRSVHPSGTNWPAIPKSVLQLWHELTGLNHKPDCCLINYYSAEAKMGLHQDRDEADMQWPVVSISLGDEGLFRMGNVTRGGKTESMWLKSGDVVVMGGDARLAYHGVDRIRAGSSKLLPKGGRLNLTLRVVT